MWPAFIAMILIILVLVDHLCCKNRFILDNTFVPLPTSNYIIFPSISLSFFFYKLYNTFTPTRILNSI